MASVGDKVKDGISGLEGVILARTEWLYGCVRLTVQPYGEKDGKPFETFVIDEPQAILVEAKEQLVAASKHGDRPAATRREI